jgi:hypothetical protein
VGCHCMCWSFRVFVRFLVFAYARSVKKEIAAKPLYFLFPYFEPKWVQRYCRPKGRSVSTDITAGKTIIMSMFGNFLQNCVSFFQGILMKEKSVRGLISRVGGMDAGRIVSVTTCKIQIFVCVYCWLCVVSCDTFKLELLDSRKLS